ncbi:MAG: FAD-dependent oxidoreductase [Lentisphaeria bacterium]|nr:FAD-dependent oxidoreductase [Lentisphaeria bacterium]
MALHPIPEAPSRDRQTVDVLVVGAGVAGVCAAIAAARNGCDTALVEMDPCLGGNSGPLLGVHVSGAHSFHPFASETGIIEELEIEAAWHHAKTRTHGHHYNISHTWDLILNDALFEAGVRVFRSHQGRQAHCHGRRLTAVDVIDIEHFRSRRFEVRHGVIDASGDGCVARSAGAASMIGSEAADVFGERSGKAVGTRQTMGTSITALVRRSAVPVPFRLPPRFAARAAAEGPMAPLGGYPSSWNPDAECCFLWVTESGGERDTIGDAAAIRDEILYQLYRTWDNVKNHSFVEKAKNWELIWVSPKSGKRESHRFVGDYVLTQTDVENAVAFPDSVAYGGYGVDIHEPEGSRARVVFYSIPPLWNLPYRCCYARDFDNLWLAGRLMSVSHLALGTVRLMRTLGAAGQAVGTAAALARRLGTGAADVGRRHIEALQQTLLRQDATILTTTNRDPDDLARPASVSASSEMRHGATRPGPWLPLDRPAGVQLWDWAPSLRSASFLVRNSTDRDLCLPVVVERFERERLWKEPQEVIRPRHLRGAGNRMEWGYDNRVDSFRRLAAAEARVPAGSEGWVRADFGASLSLCPADPTSDETRCNLLLGVCPGLELALDETGYDFCLGVGPGEDGRCYRVGPTVPAFRIDPAPPYGEARNVIDGHNRRYSTNPVHMWLSDVRQPLPQSLLLDLPAATALGRIHLTFDTIERAYLDAPINSARDVCGRCVRDYTVAVRGEDSAWEDMVTVTDNRQRQRLHPLGGRRAQAVRLTVRRAWDPAFRARVYEVRLYGPDTPS